MAKRAFELLPPPFSIEYLCKVQPFAFLFPRQRSKEQKDQKRQFPSSHTGFCPRFVLPSSSFHLEERVPCVGGGRVGQEELKNWRKVIKKTDFAPGQTGLSVVVEWGNRQLPLSSRCTNSTAREDHAPPLTFRSNFPSASLTSCSERWPPPSLKCLSSIQRYFRHAILLRTPLYAKREEAKKKTAAVVS